ncbi:MAG: hypothetical protein RL194_329 [Pseudomonadota bacterium]|jgi:hypothetical protein
MTTYTEPYRDFEALLSEAPGTLSRENITIVLGAGELAAGTVLGKITTGSSATATAFAGNSGTGTVGTITVSAGAQHGTYKLVIIEPATDAGKFQLEGPDGKIVGTGTVGAAFSKGGLAFTLADATDFIAGDGFDIVVAAGSGSYTAYDDGLANGAQVAVAVLAQSVDATSSAVSATAIVRLAEVKKDALQWHTDVDSTAKSKAYADLALVNIVAR